MNARTIFLAVLLPLAVWAEGPDAQVLALVASPAEPAATFKGRALNSSARSDDAIALFNAAHPSRFVFAGVDIDEARSHYGAQSRTVKRGEAMLINAISWSYITAFTIDGQLIEVPPDDFLMEPSAKAKLFPIGAGDLPVTIVNPMGEEATIANEPVTDSGLRFANTPTFLQLFPVDDDRKEKFIAEREKVVGCYEKQMAKLDPDNKRAKFVQETYNAKTGQTQKLESLATVLDRKACGVCKCKAFNQKEAKLKASLLAPRQAEQMSALKPVIEKITAALKK
ncbi:MAG: hypothetical protein Q8N23_34900 [Archangium sp.]|nr:hypothetical protein [Archangium sp.]MDP3571846.1 hypothetical protein [Archangium sp.]